MVLHGLSGNAESDREAPGSGNADGGNTQVPRPFVMRRDLVWEQAWIRKPAREEVVLELSSEGAKTARERHSGPREQPVQRAGGEKKRGMCESCHSKGGLGTHDSQTAPD